MKEITNIHLGRQPFTIAVDAYKELQDYLDAIKREVGKQSKDVLEEVELRMAELLHERGITGDKVVVPDDIDFLKRQLGNPGDFKEEAEARQEYEAPQDGGPRRLYRDTDNAMLAGVSSGLAAYFNIDAVIFRLLFVIATVSGGWGILLYIVMWIIIPEAKTSSERLQMHGKSVTVDSIKAAVEQADFKGTAERAGKTASKAVRPLLKVLSVAVGAVLATIGAAILFGGMTLGTLLLVHGTQVNNQVVFPTSPQEWFLASCMLMILASLALLLLLGGIELVRGRSLMPAWVKVVLAVLFFAGMGVGTAVAADLMPKMETRIDNIRQVHTEEPCQDSVFNYCTNNAPDYKPEFMPDTIPESQR
ncbi:MAG TPA: PspC domain-containing protein [Candidatus Saccharimonadales bacterium]|nr:PspC domain-containing protein [Candidatus Saccharimonadales bacterium]